ncbi:MAG: twin-arginine translocation signal domain-containing protein, partial [Planctomycetes bacterium]|nr:twin-arginine translocation signal domain-containing protein [Planctomycetota bacterium]
MGTPQQVGFGRRDFLKAGATAGLATALGGAGVAAGTRAEASEP